MTEALLCVRCTRAEDSAAAALATVASFHALPIRAHEIAPLVGLPRVRELGDLVAASRLLGFDSVPLEGSYDDLPEVARPNLVVFKDGRFVVLYEIDAASVRIADPLSGLQSLSREQFVERWTGDCLQILPGALDGARGQLALQRSLWKRLVAPPTVAFWLGVLALVALIAANRFSLTAVALAVAAASALWLSLFHASCRQCNRAHQLAGALPLDRLGALFYTSLLVAAYFDGRLIGYPLFAAAGAHLGLLALLVRERAACPPCLITAAAALVSVAASGRLSLVAWVLAAVGAAAALLAIPWFRRLAERRSLSESRRLALDWLGGAGEIPAGQVRVVVWKRVGCAACLFFEAIFKQALLQDYDGVVSLDERDAAGLHIPTPLILVAGARRTLFVGLPGRDDDYAALQQAVEAAGVPSEAGELVVVVP